MEAVTHIPWYYLAAIDQYERNVRTSRRDLPDPDGISGIYFSPEQWTGLANPNRDDENPLSIRFLQELVLMWTGTAKQAEKTIMMCFLLLPLFANVRYRSRQPENRPLGLL